MVRLDAVKVASDRQPTLLTFGAVRGDRLAVTTASLIASSVISLAQPPRALEISQQTVILLRLESAYSYGVTCSSFISCLLQIYQDGVCHFDA